LVKHLDPDRKDSMLQVLELTTMDLQWEEKELLWEELLDLGKDIMKTLLALEITILLLLLTTRKEQPSKVDTIRNLVISMIHQALETITTVSMQ